MPPTKMITNKSRYSEESFKRLEQPNAEIRGAEFEDCKFSRCDFSNTAFQHCRFIDCEFEDCNLKMASVEDCVFVRVQFRKTELAGINWTIANWNEWASKMNSIAFEECDLKYGVFHGLELKKLKLKNCFVREANFAEANLSEGDFEGSDFAGAVFLKTDISKANFVGAKNYSLNLNDNKSKGAKFSLPEAVRLLYPLNIVLIDPVSKKPLDEEGLSDAIDSGQA